MVHRNKLRICESDVLAALSFLIFFGLFTLNIFFKSTVLTYFASIAPLAILVYKSYTDTKYSNIKNYVSFSLSVGLLYPIVELLVWPLGWGEYLTQGPYLLHTSLHLCFVVPFSVLSVCYVTHRIAKEKIHLAILLTFLVSFVGDTLLTIVHVLTGNIVYYNIKSIIWVVPLAAPITDSLGFAVLPLAIRMKKPWGALFFCAALTVIWTLFYPLI